MSRWLTIAILITIAHSVCWARASVSHVTPENISNQRLAFEIRSELSSNIVQFTITISATTNSTLPEAYSASVRVQEKNKDYAKPDPKKENKKVIYVFTVLQSDLDTATFFLWIAPRTDTPMPPMGHRDGSYYHIDLLPFVKKDNGPNQVQEDTPRKLGDPQH